MPTTSVFHEGDHETIRQRGLRVEEALEQLERIRRGSGRVHLLRAATPGDGIDRFEIRDSAVDAAGREAIAAGRCSAFVPASGAATRMFQDLILALDQGIELETEASRRLLEDLPRFAFHDALGAVLERRGLSLERLRTEGRARPILEALLEPEGLGYADAPKALVLFHRAPEGSRTALDEHMVDAAKVLADAQGIARIHFTVAPECEERIQRFAQPSVEAIQARTRVRLEFGLSTQGPDSQCLAATPEGMPFREDGELIFRPGGHGALLANLAATGGDLLFIRNIDNLPAEKKPIDRWIPRILGRLAEVEREAHERLARLEGTPSRAAIEAAVVFAADVFRRAPDAALDLDRVARARALLDRPIRVCGMVPNRGEPGGGPFWVRGADGSVSLQIVEQAQVAPEQRTVLTSATHFNPVFMACALRDRHGAARDLRPFVDQDAVIVTRKSSAGRELLVLERPGLWNGSMAHWNTVFVEIPPATFAPVKTVFDLLRLEHQTAS